MIAGLAVLLCGLAYAAEVPNSDWLVSDPSGFVRNAEWKQIQWKREFDEQVMLPGTPLRKATMRHSQSIEGFYREDGAEHPEMPVAACDSAEEAMASMKTGVVDGKKTYRYVCRQKNKDANPARLHLFELVYPSRGGEGKGLIARLHFWLADYVTTLDETGKTVYVTTRPDDQKAVWAFDAMVKTLRRRQKPPSDAKR